jgi:hypothetical protein
MKKIYLSAASLLLGGLAMGQSANSRPILPVNIGHSVKQAAKSGNFSPEAANSFGSRAVHFSEDFESGVFPPAGWSIVQGAASTTTGITQEWHDNTIGNPGNCASVLYANSVDVHDEWLLSPAVVLPTGALRLEFDFNTSQFWHVDPNDNGDIVCYVSTVGGTINDLMAGDTLFWEQDPAYVNDWGTYVWFGYQADLTAYAGQIIYLGWHYAGQDAAQFNLDNISVSDVVDNDLKATVLYGADVNQDYEYGMYDHTQRRPIGMSAIIKNNGAVAQTNVGMNYEILDGSGSVVDQGSSTAQLLSLAVGASDTVFHVSGFTPPVDAESYTINVWPLADAPDMAVANDTASKPFAVAPYVWGREMGPITSGITNISTGTGEPFRIGNTYLVQGNVTVSGLEIGIGANSPTGEIIFGEIYSWDGASWAWLALTIEHTIVAADLGTVLHFDWDGETTIPLADGTDVLVVAGHYGGDVAGTNDVEIATSGNTIEGTVLGFDSGGTPFQLTDPLVPVVRMVIDGFIGIEDVLTSSAFVGQNQPNPFTGTTIVNYTVASQSDVSLELHDVMGKMVLRADQGDRATGAHQLTIDATDLAAGAYYYSLVVDGERLTRKMIVTK